MAQVSSIVPPIPPVTVQSPPEADKPTRALMKATASAVKTLNEVNHAGPGREITFSVDPASRRPVVKVIDINTKEVVQQWPAEYVLQLAADYAAHLRDSR